MTTLPLADLVPDFVLARNLMVDGQLTNVTDRRILDIMRSLPRESFVPAASAPLAYMDADVRLSPTRVLMKPLVLARLLQLATPRAGQTALVVGSGAGYGAAILAACGLQVTALEEDGDLITLARAAQAATGHGAELVRGPLAEGWPLGAPYDLVLIEGGVEVIPDPLTRQVAEGGQLVTVVRSADGTSVATTGLPGPQGLALRPAFDANTALIPAFRMRPAFAF